MSRLLLVLIAVLCLGGCAIGDLKAPCTHPSFVSQDDGCGPLKPIQ